MPSRDYKIEFFQLNFMPNGNFESLPSIFAAISDADNNECPSSQSQGGYTREIWGLRTDRFPSTVCGQFRKFRTTDIPEIGSVGELAHEIELEDNQGIIERNFFVFYEENNLIAWHKNSHSSSINQFAKFLSTVSGSRIRALPVIQGDAIERLMSGDVTLKKIELSIPRPTNPDLYPDDDFGTNIIEMMNSTNTDSLKLSMGVDLRRADTEGQLVNRLKRTIRAFSAFGATTAKALVIEDGIEYPIDLIADRVISIQRVETDAHFPPSLTMYGIIDTAKAECQEELDAYFGSVEAALN